MNHPSHVQTKKQKLGSLCIGFRAAKGLVLSSLVRVQWQATRGVCFMSWCGGRGGKRAKKKKGFKLKGRTISRLQKHRGKKWCTVKQRRFLLFFLFF
jgi:hypothetical protein